MERRFVGKVALVTGATNGIGQAAAVRLAAEGAVVAVNQRPTGDPTETLRRIAAAGGEGFPVVADMRDPAAVAAMVARGRRAWRPARLRGLERARSTRSWTGTRPRSRTSTGCSRPTSAARGWSARRGQADGRRGSWRGDLHGQLDLGTRRSAGADRLLWDEGRHQHAGQGARRRPGRARHPGERGGARLGQDQHERPDDR